MDTEHAEEPEKRIRPAERPDAHPDALPEEMRTDAVRELVDRAQAGDCDALNELFSRYYERMVKTARRSIGAKLRAKEDPDDLAQTTFREATRDFQNYEYRGEGSLLRWLLMILRNKIRDRAEYYSAGKRDVMRERSVEETGGTSPDEGERRGYDPPSDDLTVTRQVQRDEEFAILHEALEDLSDDHRKAITLVFFRGMTLREAGQHMNGRSEDAVRMLLRRAENRVRELTKRRLAK